MVPRIQWGGRFTAVCELQRFRGRTEVSLVVDLRGKLIIFLDMPHYSLLERLRPLLSHDRRELLYKITDKSKRGALRTKNVLIVGYPTIWFCVAKLSRDDQERTRCIALSPETSAEKLIESLRLAVARVGDREAFKQWLRSHPRRRWLKARAKRSTRVSLSISVKVVIAPIFR